MKGMSAEERARRPQFLSSVTFISQGSRSQANDRLLHVALEPRVLLPADEVIE
jgi:hypothetical protein